MTAAVKKLRPATPAEFSERGLTERFIPLPVDPLLELRWELEESWDGRFQIPVKARGARVKPVVYVPESRAEEVDRRVLSDLILTAGALACRLPEVHVARKKVKRDERHHVELPLRESLEIFAAETRTRAAQTKVDFSERLAVEADEGAVE